MGATFTADHNYPNNVEMGEAVEADSAIEASAIVLCSSTYNSAVHMSETKSV